MVDIPQGHHCTPITQRQIFYGCLEYIIVCKLADDDFFGPLKGQTRLLALVTPCSTNGMDVTQSMTMYSHTTAATIVDLQSIEAVVGRIATRKQWGIIDRTDGLAHTIFIDDDDEDM